MVVFVEMDLDKLAESRGIVVPGGFRVTYRLHDGRRGQNLLLNLRLRRRSADSRKVSHGILCGDRFAGARLAGNDNRLVMVLPKWN